MQNYDKLSIVRKLESKLVTKLESTTVTKIHEEITSRIGSLSTPSKMPGYAWGISAAKCKTGSKLAKIQGTPCFNCYALKGRYLFTSVHNAQMRRLDGFEDADWVELMAIRLTLHNKPHFRWFDSGDIQSVKMLNDICKVAELTPSIDHWLPTQERGMLQHTQDIPANLTIRVSSTKVNHVQLHPEFKSSSVVKTDELIASQNVWNCPSSNQGGKCGQCRACWNPAVEHVRYLEH